MRKRCFIHYGSGLSTETLDTVLFNALAFGFIHYGSGLSTETLICGVLNLIFLMFHPLRRIRSGRGHLPIWCVAICHTIRHTVPIDEP